MIYYKLPIFNNNITVNPKLEKEKCLPFISKSIYSYCNETINYIMNHCLNNIIEDKNIEYITSIIQSYGYTNIDIPQIRNYIIQSHKPSNLFYELLEILSITQILNELNDNINALHISKNEDSIDVVHHINIINKNKQIYDKHFFTLSEYENNDNRCFDFIFIEMLEYDNNNVNKYICHFIESIMIVLNSQNKDGTFLIKTNYIFHKPMVDLLYLLSNLFEKVYIIKPSVSNMAKTDRFILCSKFVSDKNKIKTCKEKYNIFLELLKLKDDNEENITSIIDLDIPCYFINKLNDINLIIGQQQLESLNHIIHILKSKNQNEKLEQLQKNNKQKGILWCEKYMISYNKNLEKPNAFLNYKQTSSNKEDPNIFIFEKS